MKQEEEEEVMTDETIEDMTTETGGLTIDMTTEITEGVDMTEETTEGDMTGGMTEGDMIAEMTEGTTEVVDTIRGTTIGVDMTEETTGIRGTEIPGLLRGMRGDNHPKSLLSKNMKNPNQWYADFKSVTSLY